MAWDLHELFQQYGKELKRFLQRRGACPETAADLTQVTFLRLLIAVPGRPVENVQAYLFRTATNLSIDLARRQRLMPLVGDSMTALEGVVDEQPSPERVLLSRQELLRLQRALDEIPVRLRDVFLARLEGKTFEEIGRTLGMPTQTAFSQMVKVMIHLKADLDRA